MLYPLSYAANTSILPMRRWLMPGNKKFGNHSSPTAITARNAASN
jgi:hypothetical protein